MSQLVRISPDYKRPPASAKTSKFQTNSAARLRLEREMKALDRTLKAQAEMERQQRERQAQLEEMLKPYAGQALERLARQMDIVDALLMLYEIKLTAAVIKRVLAERRDALSALPFTARDFLAERQLIPLVESMQFKDWLKANNIRGGSPERRHRLLPRFCAEMG